MSWYTIKQKQGAHLSAPDMLQEQSWPTEIEDWQVWLLRSFRSCFVFAGLTETLRLGRWKRFPRIISGQSKKIDAPSKKCRSKPLILFVFWLVACDFIGQWCKKIRSNNIRGVWRGCQGMCPQKVRQRVCQFCNTACVLLACKLAAAAYSRLEPGTWSWAFGGSTSLRVLKSVFWNNAWRLLGLHRYTLWAVSNKRQKLCFIIRVKKQDMQSARRRVDG